jgi:hypothetical protein
MIVGVILKIILKLVKNRNLKMIRYWITEILIIFIMIWNMAEG